MTKTFKRGTRASRILICGHHSEHTTVFLFYTDILLSNGIKITAMMMRMNRIDIYDKSVVRNNLNDENI